MFYLESGHAFLSRLLLAKACEDHDFFPPNRGLRRYFDELQGFGDEIDPDGYPVMADGMMEEMREMLVESLFEDDIFVWWTEAYGEETASQHADPYSRFGEVAQKGSDIGRVPPATRERFSRAVTEVLFAVMRFDFSAVESDPLGDLYQRCFDPETRKALGEFYTPQPVVEYIMDGVGYDHGISNERLIDPACGSGTFLVEAVERYLDDVRRYDDNPDWEEHLVDLCSRPNIVGLDIHPFAVLMAQIRFMVAILPEYREAKRANSDFTLHRLPIFRTDTLRNERESVGAELGDDSGTQMTFDAMTEEEQDVLIPVPLPIEVEFDGDDGEPEIEGDFLVRRVRMPLFDTIRLETDVRNFGEYFAALQGVLDVVKAHAFGEAFAGAERYNYQGGLESAIGRYTSREYEGIEEFFAPYVDDMLSTVRYLSEEHGDGRLFKMFEDTVLALVVKNYMEYEYVVGNPPYVRVQNLPDKQKEYLGEIYESTTGNYDIYCPFYERGFDWLTEETGKLGYITPNQFMVTDYGEGLRRYMLENVRLDEVYDFRDSGVFEDATNYPVVLIAEDEPGEREREENETRCVRVRANVDDESGRELDDAIIDAVREYRGEPGYSDDYIDVLDFPQGELDAGYWSLMPPEELDVINWLRTVSSDTVESVTDSVFAGTQTSANPVLIVVPTDADRIGPNDSGDTVTVVPQGEERQYEIETDVLRPWLQGRDVERWRGDWSGQHVILPYYIERDEDGNLEWELYDQDYLESSLPETWEYFCEHREKLEGREGGKFEDRDDWYAFGYPKSMDRFENPKLIGAEIASCATFMLDEVGEWYYKAAYGVQLEPEHRDRTDVFAGLLNSKVLDFYLKHYTSIKAGGYYKYTTNYLRHLPVSWGDSEQTTRIQESIEKITATIDLSNKTDRFPPAYLGDYDGELEYVDYEWQTRRYPVNADYGYDEDAEVWEVTAGRSDAIRDPRMDSEECARYVYEAVNGRNVKSGEETTVPIPRSDDGVDELLGALDEDRREMESTDIEALEAEIDEAVYDLFDLTDEEREVIEEYLEVF